MTTAVFSFETTNISGLYYKPITIVNDDSSIVNKLETSLTIDARVVIYDHHMFIVEASDVKIVKLFQIPLFNK